MRPPNTRMVISSPIRLRQSVLIRVNNRDVIGTVESIDEGGRTVVVRTPDGSRHACFLWRVRAA